MSTDIEQWEPDLWINGHTHFDFDFTRGATRFMAAQRGYLNGDERSEKFVPQVIEL
jgi:hypothetical protein